MSGVPTGARARFSAEPGGCGELHRLILFTTEDTLRYAQGKLRSTEGAQRQIVAVRKDTLRLRSGQAPAHEGIHSPQNARFDNLPGFQIILHSGKDKPMESAKVGKRGAIIVPARLRKRFGIEEGAIVTAEEREDGILIRPAGVVAGGR